jgi:hypothetical protein
MAYNPKLTTNMIFLPDNNTNNIFSYKNNTMQQSEDNNLIQLLTEIMREADDKFIITGGSTRHYVRDCLLPLLWENNLVIKEITGGQE